jgi:hypothetical protein
LPSGRKKGKTKMSRTPSGLAVAVIGIKKGNTKNVMNTIWSGHGWSRMPYGLVMIATRPKKRENKKFHARRLVCLWPSSAKKRKNKKCHARCLVWP